MENLSVIRQEENRVARPAVDIESLLRSAADKGKDGVEVLERLMAIRLQLNQESSKQAYDEAFAAFQAECPPIQKKKAGYKNSYNYAPLEDIIPIVQPLLRKHGFSFSVDTPADQDDKGVTAIFELRHKAGHSEQKRFRVPLDTRATLMNAPQQFGAACSYAKRYVLVNALGILTADEDLDGMANRPKPQGPSSVAPDNSALKSLASELWTLLKPVRGPEQNWTQANQWLWDNAAIPDECEAPHLTTEQFKSAIAKTKSKI